MGTVCVTAQLTVSRRRRNPSGGHIANPAHPTRPGNVPAVLAIHGPADRPFPSTNPKEVTALHRLDALPPPFLV